MKNWIQAALESQNILSSCRGKKAKASKTW